MRESKLYQRINSHLKRWGAHDRVENVIVSGMADVYYCFDSKSGWIETKVEHSGLLYFERFQIPWMIRHLRAQTPRLFVMAALEGNGDMMALYKASTIVEAPRDQKGKWQVVRTNDLVAELLMKKPYNWDELRLELTRA